LGASVIIAPYEAVLLSAEFVEASCQDEKKKMSNGHPLVQQLSDHFATIATTEICQQP
jgi:hypothetical protein